MTAPKRGQTAGASERGTAVAGDFFALPAIRAVDDHAPRAAGCARRAETVHRRILYAMRELRLSSTGGFRKSAKISGDVMGNYHPHGDAAIYDAMARLAQDFVIRYPLVDGQGNFGNIDGDNPAASRYTEARMTAMAEALWSGSTRTPSISGTITTAPCRSPRFCRPPCRTFWPTGRAGSPSAWPRTFRRTTSTSCCAPAST
jgi:hypothetical protein